MSDSSSSEGPAPDAAPSIATELTIAGGFALVFGSALLLAEGIYVSSTLKQPLWTSLFNLGAGVPLVLAGTMFALLVRYAQWLHRQRENREQVALASQIADWFWRDEALAAWRSARLLASCILVGLWLINGTLVGAVIAETVVTLRFAAALEAIGLLLTGILLYAAFPLVAVPLGLLLSVIARHPVGHRLTRPLSVTGFLLIASAVLSVLVWRRFGETLVHLPWAFAVGPAAGAAVALAVQLAPIPSRLRFRAYVSGGVSLLLLGALTLYLPSGLKKARTILIERDSAASWWVTWAERRADFDGDGVSSLYGGADCRPFDAKVPPLALEIRGNGIDEDCDGIDLKAGGDIFVDGPKHHARPDGITDKPN